jgi:uncharacterized protein YndB with AHSA1/START domain
MVDTPPTIEVTTRIKARPEVVFRYLVDPTLYVRWQGINADLDPQPSGCYRVEVQPGGFASGRFVTVDPPRRVVFTWGWEGDPNVPPGSSTVEVTLEADADETILRLRHSGLPSAPATEQHTKGWHHYLARLAIAGSGADPGRDPQLDRRSDLG